MILQKRRQSIRVIAKRRKIMKLICQQEKGKEWQRSYEKLSKTKSSSSHGILTSLALQTKEKGGGFRSVVRMKLYKSSILKAREILWIKKTRNGLANMMEEKRVMAESVMATKRDAAETKAKFRLLKMRWNMRRDKLIGAINEFARLQAVETLLMLELDLL